MTGKKFKVLIVDDSEINIEVLRFHLEERDFEVIQATNGLEAFDKAHFSDPDIILLDIMMPGVDGFEVCKALKGDEMIQGVPIIFVSAKSQPESLIKGLSMGAVDYITRPFVPEDLHQRLLMHLAEASSRITVTGETLAMGLSFAGGARKRMLANLSGSSGGASFTSQVHKVETVGGDVPGFSAVGRDHVVMTMLSVEGTGIKPTLITSTLHSLLSPEPDRGLLCSYVGADLALRAPEEVIGILEEAFPADRVGHATRLAIVSMNHHTGDYRFAARGIPLIRHLQADDPGTRLLTTGSASAMQLENGSGTLKPGQAIIIGGPCLENSTAAADAYGEARFDRAIASARATEDATRGEQAVQAVADSLTSHIGGQKTAGDASVAALIRNR